MNRPRNDVGFIINTKGLDRTEDTHNIMSVPYVRHSLIALDSTKKQDVLCVNYKVNDYSKPY